MDLKDLKARAYDISKQMQELQQELMQINAQVNKLENGKEKKAK